MKILKFSVLVGLFFIFFGMNCFVCPVAYSEEEALNQRQSDGYYYTKVIGTSPISFADAWQVLKANTSLELKDKKYKIHRKVSSKHGEMFKWEVTYLVYDSGRQEDAKQKDSKSNDVLELYNTEFQGKIITKGTEEELEECKIGQWRKPNGELVFDGKANMFKRSGGKYFLDREGQLFLDNFIGAIKHTEEFVPNEYRRSSLKKTGKEFFSNGGCFEATKDEDIFEIKDSYFAASSEAEKYEIYKKGKLDTPDFKGRLNFSEVYVYKTGELTIEETKEGVEFKRGLENNIISTFDGKSSFIKKGPYEELSKEGKLITTEFQGELKYSEKVNILKPADVESREVKNGKWYIYKDKYLKGELIIERTNSEVKVIDNRTE